MNITDHDRSPSPGAPGGIGNDFKVEGGDLRALTFLDFVVTSRPAAGVLRDVRAATVSASAGALSGGSRSGTDCVQRR